MFSSITEVSVGLAAVGYLTDEVTVTLIYLAGLLHKPVLAKGRREAERHSWRMQWRKRQALESSACSVMRGSTRTKP